MLLAYKATIFNISSSQQHCKAVSQKGALAQFPSRGPGFPKQMPLCNELLVMKLSHKVYKAYV